MCNRKFIAASASSCMPGGKYCPVGCSCEDTVVRCSNRGLTEFPGGIPLDTTELFLDSNDITVIPVDFLNKLFYLKKLCVERLNRRVGE